MAANRDQDETRYPDGRVRLQNRNIESMPSDFLYHLGLGTATHDLVEMFGDVKFVCMGGSQNRMKTFASLMIDEIGYQLPTGTELSDLSVIANRFSMYKVGPVLAVSHGMGGASLSILLHEIIKLMYHAKIKDPIFFRIGTSGGVGIDGGTVVISNAAVNEKGGNVYEPVILGKVVTRPAILDQSLVAELQEVASELVDPKDPYETLTGGTMCANDFYESQGRIDGALCDHTEEDKFQYLRFLQNKGVKNIEMESIPYASMTHQAGIKAAIVCVAFLNRLEGDQVVTPKAILRQWENRPQKLVARYIRNYLRRNQ